MSGRDSIDVLYDRQLFVGQTKVAETRWKQSINRRSALALDYFT